MCILAIVHTYDVTRLVYRSEGYIAKASKKAEAIAAAERFAE